jgi:hypothetical protein
MKVSFRQNLLPEEGEVCREEEALFCGANRGRAEAGGGAVVWLPIPRLGVRIRGTSRRSPHFPALGTIGTERKNQMYGPHFRHFDFSIFRNFGVTDWSTLHFRTEFFNLTNSGSFPNPGNTLTQGNFGRVTNVSQTYTPRLIQFVLKYIF